MHQVQNMLIYGNPSVGKSTLATALCQNYKKTLNIDGDALRMASVNLAYDRAGRIKNIENAIMVAKIMNMNGHSAVISIVAPYREMRDKIREGLPGIKVVMLKYDKKHIHRPRQEYFVADFEDHGDHDLVIDTGHFKLDQTFERINNLWLRDIKIIA